MRLLLLFICILFFRTVSAEVPAAGAVCASDQGTDVYGYDVCIWPTYAAGFADEYGLRALYKSGNDWVFLTESTHFISNFTSEQATDSYFAKFVADINQAIEQKLKPISSEPESGIDRIKWLAGRLVFTNNSVQ